jgi:phosphatidylglycerol lysyltransferase
MFLERCDDYGGVPVFYEVGKDQLHRYADFGLTFVKLGEEARIDLPASRSRGPGRRGIGRRSAISRRPAPTFRIVEPGE